MTPIFYKGILQYIAIYCNVIGMVKMMNARDRDSQ